MSSMVSMRILHLPASSIAHKNELPSKVSFIIIQSHPACIFMVFCVLIVEQFKDFFDPGSKNDMQE